nr:MAG TPA: hypothetical protein [Caudoviricetes sp.]
MISHYSLRGMSFTELKNLGYYDILYLYATLELENNGN